MWEQLKSWVQGDVAQARFEAALIAIAGFIVARIVSALVARFVARRGSANASLIVRRVTFYGLLWLTFMIALERLGLELGVLLGAAGVLTVAVGFASQTSASNIVSGLFLMGERPFVVGDSIRVGAFEGEVLSVDWLSVKLRTWQNTMVRVPNETLIKTEVENLTRFPIRRADLHFDVDYNQDLGELDTALLALAERLEFCMEEPAARVRVVEFGASGMRIMFIAWLESRNFVENRTRLLTEVKREFDRLGIVIPFQQIVIHRGDDRS